MELHTGPLPGSDPYASGFLPLLSGAAQQKFDQLAVEKFGVSSRTLMENAGRTAAFILEREFGPIRGQRVVICCGSGNNGGDGYVVARTLYTMGASVRVIHLKPPSTPDAHANYLLLQKLESSDPSGRLRIETDSAQLFQPADLYVDALLGVGLNRPLRGKASDLINFLNEIPQPVVALDLPSGLHADTGVPLDNAVRAEVTITFSAYKRGLLFGQGPLYSGQVELVHIGLPLSAVLDDSNFIVEWISTDEAISAALPVRDLQAHKYSAGMVLVIGGSPGLSGAPMLAARAAERVGAGYAACAVPERIQEMVASSFLDIPVIGLPEHPDGGIDTDSAMQTFEPWLEKATALVIGPGLGKLPTTHQFIRSILETSALPMVIDADALPIAAPLLNSSSSPKNWILTPHAGEFKRMISDTKPILPVESAIRWSSRWNCTLVLKGHPSTICHAGHSPLVCGTGNPALATAGTGDVLAGLCGGLLAQGLVGPTAAICATHIGGLAADHYSEDFHPGTMNAGDLIDRIVDSMTSLR